MAHPKGGQVIDRGCTDIICCLIFFVFLIGYVIIGFLAFYNGDPRLLLHPQDSSGNLCGLDNTEWGGVDLRKKQHLLLFDITKCTTLVDIQDGGVKMNLCPTVKVCVEECPTTYWTYAKDVPLYPDSKQDIKYSDYICEYDVDPETHEDGNPTRLVSSDKCAPYYMDSIGIFGYCVPAILEDVAKAGAGFAIDEKSGNMSVNGTAIENDKGESLTFDMLVTGAKALSSVMGATEKAASFFQDIYNAGYLILVFLGVAMAGTLLMILLLQFFAKIIVWVLIIAVLVGSGLLAAFFWHEYRWRKQEADESGKDSEDFKITTNLAYYSDLYTTYFILAIVSTVIFAVLLFTTLFLFNRVRLAIALIVEASKCVLDNLTTFFIPAATWIVMLAVLLFAIATGVYLAAFGIEVKNVNATAFSQCEDGTGTCVKEKYQACYVNVTDANDAAASSNCFLMNFVTGAQIKFMHLYNILGALWLIFFVVGCGQVIQAGVYADWYWNQGETKILPTTRSIYRTFRYHTGSVAFGSFLIALVTLIRMLLEYVDQKLKEQKQSDMAKFVLKCVKCFAYCLEKAVKVINKNAYIVIACYGKNFCSAATEALRLLFENCVRVVVLNTITEALLFVCQIGLATGMGFLSYFAIKNDWAGKYYESPELTYFLAPVIVIVLGSWLIAKLFFDVYDMAIDTLFICVLEDLEHFDGSAEKPYHMSANLQRILVRGKKHNVGDETEATL